MVILDTNSINEQSPYKVTFVKENGSYEFITDYGIKFRVGLDEDDLLCSVSAYQLCIVNTNSRRSPNDRKLRNTIYAILHEFFSQSQNAILYICDTGDGRQLMRYRLFNQWFLSYPARGNVMSISGFVVDEDGVDNFATLLLRTDHPRFADVTKEFMETIRLLNTKP